MADPALIAQLQQLAGQINSLQQTVRNLQASNTTLTTRIATLEAENTTLTAANTTLTAQVANLSGGTAAGGAAGGGAATTPGISGGGAGAAPLVTFAATPVMVNHQDLIKYSMKVGTMIYNKGCDKLTTEFNMKSSGTVVHTTELQAKCVKDGVAHGHPANHQLYQCHWLDHQYCPSVRTDQHGHASGPVGGLLQEHWSPVPKKGKAKQHNDERVHHEDAHSQTLTFLMGL
jgi:hypothetical protein